MWEEFCFIFRRIVDKIIPWCLCARASLVQWHQQPTRCSKICFIDSFKLAVRVSGDSFAHLQEHFDYIYSFLKQCTDSAVCCPQVTQIGRNWPVPSNLCHRSAALWAGQFHPICVTGRQNFELVSFIQSVSPVGRTLSWSVPSNLCYRSAELWTGQFHPICVTGRQQTAEFQKAVYTVKVLLKIGETVARNM